LYYFSKYNNHFLRKYGVKNIPISPLLNFKKIKNTLFFKAQQQQSLNSNFFKNMSPNYQPQVSTRKQFNKD